MKVSDYIFKFLKEKGVTNVFYLPGGGAMHLVDSLGKVSEIEPVVCLHEQAAVIAAEAVGQYTNNIGVALVTSGPGATNAITGVAGAWTDSTPLLVISGQVKTADMKKDSGVRQRGIQELGIVDMVKSITKYATTVVNKITIKHHLEKAFYEATSGRKGPVWLDIPLDIQAAEVDEELLYGYLPQSKSKKMIDYTEFSYQAYDVCMELLKARKPVIIAGNGIRSADALDQFKELIEKLNIPVLLTWRANDFLDEKHRLYCGRPGIVTHECVSRILDETDLVIILGARMDIGTIGYDPSKFAPQAKKIMVDIDQCEMDKLGIIDIKINKDVKDFIYEMDYMLEDFTLPDYSSWLNHKCKFWKDQYPVFINSYKKQNPEEFINPYYFIETLSNILNDDDIIAVGSSGMCVEMMLQAFKIQEGQRMFNTPGLGSMGFGLPAAFGVCKHTGKRTIALFGDGGLQHNIQEFGTIANYELPLKIFVMNNGGYGSIKHMQNNRFNGHHVGCDFDSGLNLSSTTDIAKAYGLATKRLYSHKNLELELIKTIQEHSTTVCEVFIDPTVTINPKMKV